MPLLPPLLLPCAICAGPRPHPGRTHLPPPPGLAALIYIAHPFHPDPRPADPAAAAAVGYANAKTGVWAVILVFLGEARGSWEVWRAQGALGCRLACFAAARAACTTQSVGTCSPCKCPLYRLHSGRPIGGPITPSPLSPLPPGYSVVQGPTPPMVRPHPAFWRLVHGIMVVYLLFMVYLLLQNVHDARQFLRVGG